MPTTGCSIDFRLAWDFIPNPNPGPRWERGDGLRVKGLVGQREASTIWAETSCA